MKAKINLVYVTYWDNFNMDLYFNYLKTLKNVDNTLSRLHTRSMEDLKKNSTGRDSTGGKKECRPVAKINNKN